MRALKILVVGLGIAVVIAFLTLVTLIINRGDRSGQSVAREETVRPPVRASWGRVVVEHPPGSRVMSVTASGGLVVLHVQSPMPGAPTPGGEERLIVLDPATGAVHGIFQMGAR